MIGSVKVWKSGGLRIVRDDDKFGSSEVYSLRGTMMSLEVRKFTCCV